MLASYAIELPRQLRAQGLDGWGAWYLMVLVWHFRGRFEENIAKFSTGYPN
jgi:hypothetical protein